MKNLNNYNIKNKKILFRADLNVPVIGGIITDTSRIKAIKSSIEILTSNKNKIFLLAHFGRPNGEVVEKYSLNFILSSLKDILNLDKIYFLYCGFLNFSFWLNFIHKIHCFYCFFKKNPSFLFICQHI